NDRPFSARDTNMRGARTKLGLRSVPNTPEIPTVTTASESGFDHHSVHHAEDGRRRADPERQRQNDGEGEGWLLPQQARRIAQVLPDIAEDMPGWSAGCDGRQRLALLQRRQISRQPIPVLEFGECQTCGVVLRRPARHQLPPSVFKMLRELFDDLVFAGYR